MNEIGLLLAAFLLGAIPTGLLVVRAVRGVDVREHGSGNIGATNVVRVAGWGWGLLTLAIDAVKGAIVPLVFLTLSLSAATALRFQLAAAVLALAGNIANPFLKFRGGKGIGTAIGVTAVIAPLPFLLGLAAFALLFAATRIVSVGSLSAGLVFTAAAVVRFVTADARPPWEWLGFCALLGALIFITHRANIRRLLRGEERRLTRSE